MDGSKFVASAGEVGFMRMKQKCQSVDDTFQY